MVLIYDYHPYGHCPGWMALTAEAFLEAGCSVTVACYADAEGCMRAVRQIKGKGGNIESIPSDVHVHAAYAAQLAERLGIQYVFFPNFDTILLDLGDKGSDSVDLRGRSFGGIWLRPTLEGEILSGVKKALNKVSRTATAKKIRRTSRTIERNHVGMDRFLNGRGAAQELFLFLLQAEAKDDVLNFLPESQLAYICDPWLERSSASRQAARTKLGLDANHIYFLHAGTSRPDKGLADACQAFLRLPQSVRESAKLLRAGSVNAQDAPLLKELEKTGNAVVMNRYVSDEELLLAYAACDCVLLPYRDQKESSGVFIHAAAHERPVVVSDFGVIGRWTKQYNLGWTFPHKDVSGLAQVLENVCQYPVIDPVGMQEFSGRNSSTCFKESLIQKWGVDRCVL